MTKKRIGRPFKPAKPRTRAPLGLIVRAEVKARIEAAAKRTGRTQSQEAEFLIERAIHYDEMLEVMKTNLQQIERGNIEAALTRLGWKHLHDPSGGLWAPPGHPLAAQRSGFMSDEEAAKFMGKKDAR